MPDHGEQTPLEELSPEGLLKLLETRGGQLALVARAAYMANRQGADRLDVERSKALRQCVESAKKITEIDEMEDLVRRNEAAAARMENPDAADPEGAGEAGASGQPSPSGEVH